MSHVSRIFVVCLGAGLAVLSAYADNGRTVLADGGRTNRDEVEHFERKIRPLLARRCYACHSEKARTVHGGLKLDTAAALARGGDSGPAVVAGQPEDSLLIQAVRHDAEVGIEMPPRGRLPESEIAELETWVKRGAVFPGPIGNIVDKPFDLEAARDHWSFRSLSRQSLPATNQKDWPRQRLDHFVLAVMEQHGLQPTPEPDRATLLRRLSFDLIGLPPTPDELAAFQADQSPGAWERQVDRLLQSPHFGERWGRSWLDLARYTDKTAKWLDSTGHSYLYRDWVVQAVNDDMPYDEFIHRQLATDLMSETGPGDIPALGFLGLSPNYWKELKLPAEIIRVIVADEWEERVDAVSRTFLGLTVACARCHDHKFDPVTTRDYYAMAGVFASCRLAERPLIDPELFKPVQAARKKVAELEKQLVAQKKIQPKPVDRIRELTEQIATLKSTPHYDTPLAPAVVEESLFVERQGKTAQDGTKLVYRAEPRDLNLFIRGDPNRPAEVVPRRFLAVLSAKDAAPFRTGSGRLDLARAITGDAASLAARVIVNRIWLGHFGRGLVATPSNFGRSGERPSHPALLDDLAARLIEENWSLRQLHREIVLSATWRQASRTDITREREDPENRWLSRMNQRRLEVEAWRDAMLAACGELDLTIGGPSVSLTDTANRRRTLYGTVHRREMSTMLLTHDFPDPTAHSPQRLATTTTLQGLYALNGPLLLERSTAFARRLAELGGEDDSKRIRQAYLLAFARAPTPREVELGLAFLGEVSGAERDAVWTQYAHVLLASNEFLFVD